MNDALKHRGPDDEGSFVCEGFAFGMRRLSIVDLAFGRQPMFSENGVGIILNGEIYNYRALRKELEGRGHCFRNQSDTEVLLHVYLEYGLSGLGRLDGMFAFCIYDAPRRVVHLVRDRVGKKPLYFADCNGPGGPEFFFSSEIKSLIAGLSTKPRLNMQAVHDYLTLRFVPGRESIWKGIQRLEPAHSLTYDLDKNTWYCSRYWDYSFNSQAMSSGRNYEEEFRHLFLSAVESRLCASDVPVGVLLSGGLDSSAIVAAASELGHQDLHSFSVDFADGGAFSESRFATQVADHIGTSHHRVTISKAQFIEFLDSFVYSADEPLADLASIPLFFVSRLAHQYVKVVLSGEGSDEVLAGYDMEFLAARLERLRKVSSLVPPLLLRVFARIAPGRVGESLGFLSDGWCNYLRSRGSYISFTWNEAEKAGLWGTGFSYKSTEDLIRSWFKEASSRHPIDQLQEAYCREWLVEDLLMKADKMTMAASVELRCPFLDHKLVEWATSLPLEWKVGSNKVGWSSKRILRAFARGRIPEEIIARPKQGFPVPAYQWLREDLGSWALDRLIGSASKLRDIFDVTNIKPVVVLATNGCPAAARKIWSLVILETWLRRWT